LLLGVWADLGALLLVIFLLPTAYLMHGFWREVGEARLNRQVQFNKDLALAERLFDVVRFLLVRRGTTSA
jgi:uncharacterized membrane protein YphA (DoxX/SURF4 family)